MSSYDPREPAPGDDPVDPALRAALRRAVDDVDPAPDLDGVLAGARRASDGPTVDDRRDTPARRRLVAVAAVAAAVATIVGASIGADVLSSRSGPPVATSGPAPVPTPAGTPLPTPDGTDEVDGSDRGAEGADPFAPVDLAAADEWLVPAYRVFVVGATGSTASATSVNLRGEMQTVVSDGSTSDLLRAALELRLEPGDVDFGLPSTSDLQVDGDGEGTVQVSLTLDALAPGVADVTGGRGATLQQLAWTARSVLQSPVELSVTSADGATQVVTPRGDALDPLQIAYPVAGAGVDPDGEIRLAGRVDARIGAVRYEFSEDCRDGCGAPVSGAGDIAVEDAVDDTGFRRFDVSVPAPQGTGSVSVTVTTDQSALGQGVTGYGRYVDAVPSTLD